MARAGVARALVAAVLLLASAAHAWELELSVDMTHAQVRGTVRLARTEPKSADVRFAWRADDLASGASALTATAAAPANVEARFIVTRVAGPQGALAALDCRLDDHGPVALIAEDALTLRSLVPEVRGPDGALLSPTTVRLRVPSDVEVIAPGIREAASDGAPRQNARARPEVEPVTPSPETAHARSTYGASHTRAAGLDAKHAAPERVFTVTGADASTPFVFLRAPRTSSESGVITLSSRMHEASGEAVNDTATSTWRELSQALGVLPWKRVTVAEAPLPANLRGLSFEGVVLISSTLFEAAERPAEVAPGIGSVEDARASVRTILDAAVSHELAHQWFGGWLRGDPERPLITEALAQYFGRVAHERAAGKAAGDQLERQQWRSGYRLLRAQGVADGRVDGTWAQLQANGGRTALMYLKGPLGISALREAVGDAAFFRGIQSLFAGRAGREPALCTVCVTRSLTAQRPELAAQLDSLRARWWEQPNGDADIGTWDVHTLCASATPDDLDPLALALLKSRCDLAGSSGQTADERTAVRKGESTP